MPEAPPAEPAPAVAAPPATPPAPPAPAAAPTPPAPEPSPNQKLAKKLHDLLLTPTDDSAPPAKKPEVKAPDAVPPADAPPAEPSAADKDKGKKGEIRVPKKPEPAAPTPPRIPSKADLVPTPPAAAAPAASPPAKTQAELDADFEKELVEEERVQLDDARAAERHMPEKYKGQGTKMAAFLKENVKKTEALDKGEIEQSEYESWYAANIPKIGALDFRNIQHQRVKDDVAKEFEPKIEAERHARWVDSETPKLTAKGNETRMSILTNSYPEEVIKAMSERSQGLTRGTPEWNKAVADVRKDYALEVETTERIVEAANEDIQELRRLTTVNPKSGKTLTELEQEAQVWDGQKWVINPNPRTERGQAHARILSMVNGVCEEYAKAGADLQKDGKWFVTREQWADMTPAQRGPFWTFSIDDVINRASGMVRANVAAAVQYQIQQSAARGFKRTFAAPPAPAATPPAPPSSGAPPAPRSTPPPAPGAPAAGSLGSRLASQLTSTPAES